MKNRGLHIKPDACDGLTNGADPAHPGVYEKYDDGTYAHATQYFAGPFGVLSAHFW